MSITIVKGDCRDVLRTLPDESVHCVVTSPPYWGLRDYGVPHQIGLEDTYAGYIDKLVGVFKLVRRVLRSDGTVWLNLGDSYAGHNAPGWRDGNEIKNGGASNKNGVGYVAGLKPKDLCGIPWRVAFALQADGWWLRQDIIWSKPNPMPESVTDRCTKAHEYLFLLSKSERYYYDAEAIAEKSILGAHVRDRASNFKKVGSQADEFGSHDKGAATIVCDGTRNKRSVWEIATSPFPEAHFATFPPALIEPCIKAGTSEKGCCAECGAAWGRITERVGAESYAVGKSAAKRASGLATAFSGYADGSSAPAFKTIGWSPSCSCNAAVIPCAVLDPFGGAGTTGLVADRLGRNAILIELNPEYAEMAERRIRNDAGMFAQVAAE